MFKKRSDKFCSSLIEKILLFLILLIFSIFAFRALYEGHNWGDDFGAYLHLASNIADGRPYLANYSGVDAPPGFPIILAGWMSVFGKSFIGFKTINVISWVGTISFSYLIVNRFFNSKIAILSCAFLSILPFYYYHQNNILTDIPTTFLYTLYIWVTLRVLDVFQSTPISRKHFILLMIFGGVNLVALLIRPAALPLSVGTIAAVFGILLSQKFIPIFLKKELQETYTYPITKISSSMLIILACLSVIIINFMFFGSSSNDHISNISRNYADTEALFSQIFLRGKQEASNMAILFLGYGISKTEIVILVSSASLGFFAYIKKTKDLLIPMICLAHVFMLLLTPWSNGPRYLLPITVPLMIFIVSLISLVITTVWNLKFKKYVKVIFSFMMGIAAMPVLLSIYSETLAGSNFNDEELLKPDAQSTFNWLIKNTTSKTKTCSFKPRAFMFMTNRPACWVNPKYLKNFGDYLKDVEAEYAVLPRGLGYTAYEVLIDSLVDDPSVDIAFETDTLITYRRLEQHREIPPIVPLKPTTVVITATGKKNDQSKYFEVWFYGALNVYDKPLDLKLVNSGFVKKNNSLISSPVLSEQPAKLTLEGIFTRGSKLEFLKHNHSGIISIKIGENDPVKYDLYQEKGYGKLTIPIKNIQSLGESDDK